MQPPDWNDKHEVANYRYNQFNMFCAEARELFVRKNHEYGDAIALTGVQGAIVEVITVAARLQQLSQNLEKNMNKEQILEEIRDKTRDLHNYAIILDMMIKDKNWTGKEFKLPDA